MIAKEKITILDTLNGIEEECRLLLDFRVKPELFYYIEQFQEKVKELKADGFLQEEEKEAEEWDMVNWSDEGRYEKTYYDFIWEAKEFFYKNYERHELRCFDWQDLGKLVKKGRRQWILERHFRRIEKHFDDHGVYAELLWDDPDVMCWDVYNITEEDLEFSRQEVADFGPDAVSFLDKVQEKPFLAYLKEYCEEKGMEKDLLAQKAILRKSRVEEILDGSIPTKREVMALGFALEIKDFFFRWFLNTAGYCLVPNSGGAPRDIVVNYCLFQEIYDLAEVNLLLNHFELEGFFLSNGEKQEVKKRFPEKEVFAIHRYLQKMLREEGDSLQLFPDEIEAIQGILPGECFAELMEEGMTKLEMTGTELAEKANLDKRLISKIKNNYDYRPGRDTAIAIGLALELDTSEFEHFLASAGLHFDVSKRRDLIIRYYVEEENFDIHHINEALHYFEEKPLGYKK